MVARSDSLMTARDGRSLAPDPDPDPGQDQTAEDVIAEIIPRRIPDLSLDLAAQEDPDPDHKQQDQAARMIITTASSFN